jgi:hypothetical protein
VDIVVVLPVDVECLDLFADRFSSRDNSVERFQVFAMSYENASIV